MTNTVIPKMLIVDDIPSNLAVLSTMLSSLPIEIIEADSAEKAIALSQQHEFFLLFLDVIMPEMDGYELADYFKANPKTKDIPLIFLTALLKGQINHIQGYKHGAIDFIEKPVSVEILIPKVRAFLKLWLQSKELIKAKEEVTDALQTIKESQYYIEQQKFAFDQHAIVSITNLEGNIVEANQNFIDTSGYSRQELIGQNHRLINSNIMTNAFWNEMYQTITKGETWKGLVRNKKKNGDFYWLDTTIVPFKNSHNEPINYVGICSDVTEEVEHKKALVDAKIEAEDAVKVKSEFLARMSHEIRTPMNGILGMLGLLLNGKLTEEQQHQACLAEGSAKALLALINDILDYSKIEAEKLDLEEIDFNLRSLLGDFAESMAVLVRDKNVEIILDVAKVEQSMVKGDPGRLRQILTNIVGNAIKFTDKGEIVIVVKLFIESNTNNNNDLRLKVSVQDSGIGIEQDKLALLFKSFSQVDASITRKYGGTGLGLSIAQKLCQMMNGHISVSSIPNKGSRFEFDVSLQTSKESQFVMPLVDMKKLKILLVDDNTSSRQVLSEQLLHWGANVTEVNSGEDALTLCHKHYEETKKVFDIVMIDMQMPIMDGAQLGKEIRKNKLFDAMKMVLMTSISHRGDAQYFANLGFNAYFPKPATTTDLFHALSVVADNGEVAKNAKPLVTSHYVKSLKQNELQQHQSIKWAANSRLLLVEDNKVNQLVAKGILKNMDLSADVAENGIEAIACIKQASEENKPYDLILMDVQMPKMDGYEASQYIRSGKANDINSQHLNNDIPIIAMTANALQGDREKCLKAGMSDYLSKPINPEQVKKMLCQWLQVKAG